MKEFLSSQGFKYEQDEDNDIFFKYQMPYLQHHFS